MVFDLFIFISRCPLMDLEQALIVSMTPGENQQNALDYLNKITQDPQNFQATVELFFKIQDERARLLLSFIIYRFLDTSWPSIDQQLIMAFRNQILELFLKNVIPLDLSKQLEMIISNIAFNQWPEIWPNFIGELITLVHEINDTANLSKIFHILTNLVSLFSTSQFISLMRRNLLIQELQYKIPDIIQLLQSISFEQVTKSEIGQSFIAFMQLYCNLNLDDNQICYNLASFLFTNFAPYMPSTFVALQNLISKSRIDQVLFHLSIQNIVELMGKPLTDQKAFISFICHIIKVSINILPQSCVDQNFFPTIRCILGYTLTNMSKTDFWEDVWSLWSLLLNVCADGVQLRTSAVYLVLEPILPTVLESLYEYLPTAMSQSRLLSFQPISCFVAYTMINENMLLTFLAQKNLSQSLLISIGIIYFLNDNEIFDSILNNIIPQLISGQITEDLNATLFAISRNTSYLSNHLDILSSAFNMFTNLITSGNMPTIQTLLLALNHIASSIPEIVAKQCPEFIMFCLGNIVDPNKLQHDDFLRVCRIMSKLVASVDGIENQKQLSEILTTPVSQLLTSEDQDTILYGCETVYALASISELSVGITMEFLWNPLSIALNNMKESESFSIVCDSFSTTIRTCSFKNCISVITSFVAFAQSIQNQDCAIVHTFAQIRLCHREMDDYRQMICDTYIQNMINSQMIVFEFFEFFDAFDILEKEQVIVVPAACQAIRCFDAKISKCAANLLLKHFEAQMIPFKIRCECDIIIAIFDALFDQVHHQCLKKLLKLLHQVVDVMHKREIPFEECIFEAIRNRVCDDEYSKKFVIALKNSVAKKEMFIDLVANLLIAAGRGNPNEFQMLSDVVLTRSKVVMPKTPFQNEDEIGKC